MSTYNYTGFSENEYNCLLSAFGMDSFIGFKAEGQQDSSQEGYDSGIFSLHQRGLIHNKGEGFEPSEKLREIFGCIKNPGNIFLLSEVNKELPQYCLYKAEKILMVTPGIRRGEYIRCAVLDAKDITSFMEESGYDLPTMEIRIEEIDVQTGTPSKSLNIEKLKELL